MCPVKTHSKGEHKHWAQGALEPGLFFLLYGNTTTIVQTQQGKTGTRK